MRRKDPLTTLERPKDNEVYILPRWVVRVKEMEDMGLKGSVHQTHSDCKKDRSSYLRLNPVSRTSGEIFVGLTKSIPVY